MPWGPVFLIIALAVVALLLPLLGARLEARRQAKELDQTYRSARLVMRHPTQDDRDFYVEMAADETASQANGWAGNEPAVIRGRFDNPKAFADLRAADLVAFDQETGVHIGTATIGTAPIETETKPAYMIGIHVHPDHRSAGYGRELMESAIIMMRARWDGPLYVGTHVDNIGMQRIMDQIGFGPEPKTRSYVAPNGESYESYWYPCSIDIDPAPTNSQVCSPAKIGDAYGVFNLFQDLFVADPSRTFLIEGDRKFSYGDYQAHARRLGAAVQAQGLAPGDRLVAQTNKSGDGFALWLGCLAAGVVYVPTNTAYTPAEISYFCDDAGATLLVVDDPNAVAEVDVATIAIADLVATANELEPIDVATVNDSTPAALVYTSGTTGRPKGATLTHGCLRDNANALAEVWEFSADDILVHSLPIFHVHGLFIALHPTMISGASTRFLPKFDPASVIEALEGASVFMGVPTYYHRLLATDQFTPDACASMRLFTSGSAPMTEITHAEFTERTGRQIVERYGMSEAGIIASNRIDNVAAGSVGHALPGYELRIVDDDGSPIEAGQTGTVEVRGPSLCAGYWHRPDADAESRTDDGWFNTGDVGSIDDTHRLTLEGRSSDMIISGGLNIYPKEIEMVIDEIDGVIESAVVGHPHEDFGEAVVAYLVLEPQVALDSIDLDQPLSSLARFKHPKAVHVLDELPRNAMGKVQKNLLRSATN